MKAILDENIQAKKKKSIFKKPKLEGVGLLFLITVRKSFSAKASKGTGITFLVLSFIFTLVTALTNKGFKIDATISVIAPTIGYIFIVFFYVVFLTILVVSLFKVPIMEGIQQIETRAGVSLFKSFLIRYFSYITVTYSYLIINLIFAAILSTTFSNQPLAEAILLYSPVLFLMLFTLIWFPVLCLISLISSVAMGTFGNIFLGAILSLLPFISGMANLVTSNSSETQLSSAAKAQTARLVFANDFYKKFINDSAVKQIFEEEENSKNILETISKNLQVVNINDLSLDTLSSSLIKEFVTVNEAGGGLQKSVRYKPVIEALIKALYLGQFNLDVDTAANDFKKELDELNNDKSNNGGNNNDYNYNQNSIKQSIETPLIETNTVFSGLGINTILESFYKEVYENMFTANEAPVSYPGYSGSIFIGKNNRTGKEVEKEFLDISDLVKWLSNKLPQYKSLLSYVSSQYKNYNEILFNRVNTSNDGGTTYSNNTQNSIFKTPGNIEDSFYSFQSYSTKNSEVLTLYKRYPELMMINNLITQNWVNTMSYSTDFLKAIRSASSSISSDEKMTAESGIEYIASKANKEVSSSQINIINHFYIFYQGLIGNHSYGDAFFTNKDLIANRSLTTKISNFKSYSKYATAKNTAEMKGEESNNTPSTGYGIETYFGLENQKPGNYVTTLPAIYGEVTKEKILAAIQERYRNVLSENKDMQTIRTLSIKGLTAEKLGNDWYIKNANDKQNYWVDYNSEKNRNEFSIKVQFSDNKNNKLQSIFKETPLQKGIGFNIIGVAFIYLAISLLSTGLVFLVFKRLSRI
ncbi:ABC transporter permease [Spiroplasma gladiatoris]|uniref:ABC transporter permease n=1 Tax=Spiroplasma gladiatoris TaxID=2143 RepID=A0A4P7AG53_9MOLU|nr:hypothetical protein [Spiroplasma gladiatoris]QBQ07325.1 ABC transporter permease [Spiroplasma gladiatoris]